ncbi:hypothetical protein ALGA_2359 [Labilibaculum antarcticum]|uniref:HYR domain-containing protein n=1 Tax=Labilibaculum antarcticum TaxID=1717717 RepID=A0A1Y1CJW5_9BACT|nr:hypothetical protein ALGA_2359 [Labilibaculum antarcticum]
MGQTASVLHPTTPTSNDGSITINWPANGVKYVKINGIQKANNVLNFNGLDEGDYVLEYWRKSRSDWNKAGDETVTLVAAPYCLAKATNQYEYISRVQVGSIDKFSGWSGYSDYTSLLTDVNIGVGYSITITNGYYWSGDQYGIWVDWNQDGDFNDKDETISASSGSAVFIRTITPPSGATIGSTRMRIRINDGAVDACGDSFWGEVEDYTLNIVSPDSGSDPCTPAVGATAIWNENFNSLPIKGVATFDYGDLKRDEYPLSKSDWGLVGNNLSPYQISGSYEGVWLSEAIPISSYSDIKVSMDVGSWAINGNSLEDTGVQADYVRVYYIVGGVEYQFDTSWEFLGDISLGSKSCTTVPDGGMLQIRVVLMNTFTDELQYIDNIKVTGVRKPPEISSITSSACEKSNAEITIEGNYLDGATEVTVGGKAATIKSNTTDEIIVILPDDATTGKITVTIGGISVTSDGDLVINPLVGDAGIIAGDDVVLKGQTSVSYKVSSITNSDSYEWSYSGTGETINNNGNNEITIDFADDATSGDLTVSGVNSCGNGNSSALSITVNSGTTAAPEITARGDQSICADDNKQIFVVESIMVTSGTALVSMSVQISGGYVSGEDKLELFAGPDHIGDITSSWDETTGMLILTGSASTTDAQFQNAIKYVEFVSLTSPRTEGPRTFSITLEDANFLPESGHFYQFVSELDITWTDARDEAEKKTYYGLKGYLATLTSEEEAVFAGAKITGSGTIGAGWIGASDADGDEDGEWRWVTGPEGKKDGGKGLHFWQGRSSKNGGVPVNGEYSRWNTNTYKSEPNNSSDEYYAHITDPTHTENVEWGWNDLDNRGGSGQYQPKGYIVEYGGFTTDPKLSISASTTIMVGDTELPVIGGMPADIIITNCNQVVNWTEPTALDKCGAVTLTKDYDPGKAFPFGETVVTYTATNGAGRVPASFKVTVQDGGQAPLLCFEAENYAFEGSASQSSLYGSGIAPRAVDGNISGDWSDNSVTHTQNNLQEWWQVDLGAQENVDYVNIYRRTNCCPDRLQNFYVLLSDNDLQSVSLTDALHDPTVESYYVVGDPSDLKRILTSGNTFRYVKIQLSGTNYLSLAEVEVMGCTSQTKANINISAESGKCSAQATWDTPSAIDNCGTVTLSSDHNSGDDFPVGTTKVTYTATDGANELTSSFNVIVTDDEDPTITCPGNQNANYTSSCNYTLLDYTDTGLASVSDNCDSAPVVTQSPAAGTIVGVNTTITLTATDASSNSSDCSFDVILSDTTDPVIPKLEDVTGECSATVVAPTTADACAGTITGTTSDPLTYITQGTHTITWNFDDGNGNDIDVTQDVVIADVTDPTIISPVDVTAFADAGLCTASSVVLGMPKVADNCMFASGEEGSLPTVNLGLAGEFTILSETGVTSVFQSNITGDVGSGPIGGTSITLDCAEVDGTIYSVDAAGPKPCAVTNASRLAKAVADMAAAYTDAAGRVNPDFYNFSAGIIGGKTLTPGLYSFTTAVTIPTDVTIAGGPNDIWIFQIAGTLNMSSAVKIILTGGAQAKNIFWQTAGAVTLGTYSHFEGIILGKTSVALQTGASINGRFLSQTAVTLDQNTVNCANGSVTSDAPAVFPIGITTVTWTVTDASGNTATCKQTVTVSDNEAPTIAAPVDVAVDSDLDNCTASSVMLGTPVTDDNCGIKSVKNNAPVTFPLGETIVIWTVTDNVGLKNTATQKVTVTDKVEPIAICQNITVQLDATCNVTIAATDIDNGSSDNCGITSMSLSKTTFSCYNVGANKVTLTVKDAHGNTGNCVALVTIEDEINPTITCPDDVKVFVDAGLCTASSVALGTPIIADNCGEEEALPTVNLGLAGEFAILSKTGITSVFKSTITGDVGSGPITGAAMTLSCLEVAGTIYSVDAAGPSCVVTDASRLATAVTDMQTAYADAAGRVGPDFLDLGAGNIGGKTLTRGLYKFTTAVTIPTDVTIAGGPKDIWIFQIASTLDMSANVRVTLTGGAQAKNIFWQTAGAVTLGAASHFEGIIMGKTSATLQTGASINGMLLAQTAVTMGQSTVTNPVVLGTPTAVDNCTIASIKNNGPAVFPIGTTEVTWTVTDGSGNTATCTQNVTVTDDSKPILTDCPTNITVGACNNTVNWIAPTVTDNCTFELISTHQSGDIFTVGTTTTVIYTATDKADNIATCSFDITVTDDEKPILENLKSMSITLCADEGTKGDTPQTAKVDDLSLSEDKYSDNCSSDANMTIEYRIRFKADESSTYVEIVSFGSDPDDIGPITTSDPSGYAFPVGISQVTYKVMNEAGKSKRKSFWVTVNPKPHPIGIFFD